MCAPGANSTKTHLHSLSVLRGWLFAPYSSADHFAGLAHHDFRGSPLLTFAVACRDPSGIASSPHPLARGLIGTAPPSPAHAACTARAARSGRRPPPRSPPLACLSTAAPMDALHPRQLPSAYNGLGNRSNNLFDIDAASPFHALPPSISAATGRDRSRNGPQPPFREPAAFPCWFASLALALLLRCTGATIPRLTSRHQRVPSQGVIVTTAFEEDT